MVYGHDEYLSGLDMTALPDVAINVFGIKTTLHCLAVDDWTCRIKQNLHNQSRISICFRKNSQTIRFVLPTQRWYGCEELFKLLAGLEQVSSVNCKVYSKPINRCTDVELLDELARRNPVKKKKKKVELTPDNVHKIEHYLRTGNVDLSEAV